MAHQLTLDALESWLWESANILRGSIDIDSSDFKNYIFVLLFLKCFNDVFEERVCQLMANEGLSRSEADAEVCEDHGALPALLMSDEPWPTNGLRQTAGVIGKCRFALPAIVVTPPGAPRHAKHFLPILWIACSGLLG